MKISHNMKNKYIYISENIFKILTSVFEYCMNNKWKRKRYKFNLYLE